MIGGPLLTKEQVESWVAERVEVARQHAALGVRLEDLDRKLAAVELLLPSALASALLHPEEVKSRAEASFTDLCLSVLHEASRGLTPVEIRSLLIADPEVGERAQNSHNGVTNALSRLYSIKRVVRRHGRYYLPENFDRFLHAEALGIDGAEAPEDPSSFNAMMHEAMRAYGKPFVAKNAIAVGKGHAGIAAKLQEQPSRIYSWLNRELGRGKLARDDDGNYYYPSQRDGALNGHAASAPSAGGGATPPIEDRPGFRLVG